MALKEVTEEQKVKLKKLRRSSIIRNILIGIKISVILFISVLITSILNAILLKSDAFAIVMGLLNGFMIFSVSRQYIKEESQRVTEELKKILEE